MNLDIQDPVPETFTPIIHACITHPIIHLASSQDVSTIEPQQVEVVRRDNPTQAYMVIPSMGEENLDHHADGWGHVVYGVCLPRLHDDDSETFQAPSVEQATYVAIKRLSKPVVQASLARGINENPYKEISRMQELGDNHHVLSCIEALEDEEFLYIIMPYCEQGSLAGLIPWSYGFQEDKARAIFIQLLENLKYLHSHNICHRDMSPDNCMVYNNRIVFVDLAMSFRIPESGWVSPLGGFGKPPYMAPELYFGQPFWGRACDTWSIAVILFNMLTGHMLCSIPMPSDLKFRYLVLAQGISRNSLNEQTIELLMNEDDTEERRELLHIIQKCLGLSVEAQDLLQGSLTMDRTNRWTSDHMEYSPWLAGSE
mmetsp:Transcript_27073/g.76174  ORF Transcript_27073/g.76174 Transcript_27073/m.76174 type:complete len:370 (+) Transcript_27073:712-1821(+)